MSDNFLAWLLSLWGEEEDDAEPCPECGYYEDDCATHYDDCRSFGT